MQNVLVPPERDLGGSQQMDSSWPAERPAFARLFAHGTALVPCSPSAPIVDRDQGASLRKAKTVRQVRNFPR